MTDPQTLAAYDLHAGDFAQDWHTQPPPSDLHALVRRFFRPGLTADIGCGSGREVAWLCQNGFAAVGYDLSAGLIAQARARYPDLEFATAALPDLAEIGERRFANVLCETVLMHLPPASIAPAVRRLVELLEPGGTLYVSWRVTEGSDQRDQHGRLYAAFDKQVVLGALGASTILLDEDVTSLSSGKRIQRLVARKG
jgi:SAM-dependent methyltransferase